MRGTDDNRRLLQDMLGGDHTRGLDLDCLYATARGYALIEFCKAEKIPAYESHPRRYWQNWRKFYALAWVAAILQADFYIVNYDEERRAAGLLRVRKVTKLDPSRPQAYIETQDVLVDGQPVRSFEQLKQWFRELNARALPAWEVHKIKELRSSAARVGNPSSAK
jgi:hypothetical protein